jgi:galactofuranosylgalactofuranosylrhamnosyl-N-acetylglucosaminyl-diphospho-decaprenol beta-1,5/1,6-galactofuranosyltransferase
MHSDSQGLCRIQRVIFPADGQIPRLYLRAELADGSGAAPTGAQMPRWQRLSVLVPQGVAISLATLFNHLPEAYWLQYTAATGFVFRALLSGVGEIQLLRRTAAGEDVLLAMTSFNTVSAGAAAVLVELRVDAPVDRIAGAGVLFVRIGARSGDVVLGEADWSALGVAPAPVRLVAGYCTFKRETQLLDNVQRVMGDTAARERLSKLVVVDQGASASLGPALEDIARTADTPALALVQQDNFGGSGGFARVMLEALSSSDATHVLLMDDDAKIETESICRAAAFLSLTTNTAVGGQMLDLYRPGVIHESGAWFRSETMTVTTHTPHLDATRPSSLTAFTRVAHTDYNGWWFFALPVAAIRANGLPLPLFLHNDDIEYGIRLRQRGIETVTVPGIAVWHEPFYAKRGSWQVYYDVRNLIINACASYGISGASLPRQFIRSFMGALLGYEYDSAALQCLAIEDWLRGPSVLRAAPQGRHASLFKATDGAKPSTIPLDCTAAAMRELTTVQQALRVVLPPKGWRYYAMAAKALLRNLVGSETRMLGLPVPSLPQGGGAWWNVLPYRAVAIRRLPPVVAFTGASDCYLLHRSPASFRRLLPRGLLLYGRLLATGRRRARQWREAAGSFHSVAFWQRYLGFADAAADRRVPPAVKEREGPRRAA